MIELPGWPIVRDLIGALNWFFRRTVTVRVLYATKWGDHLVGSRVEATVTGPKFLVWIVTNTGNTEVVLQGVGAEVRKAWFGKRLQRTLLRSNVKLPYRLKPGEQITVLAEDLDSWTADDVQALTAWDTTGREWEAPKHELQRVRSEWLQEKRQHLEAQ